MILKLIQNWFEYVVSEFNKTKSDSLQLHSVTVIDTDFSLIPFNQTDMYYQLTLQSTQSIDDYNSEIFDNVLIKIDLFFMVTGKSYSDYQTLVDRYLWSLRRFIKNNRGFMSWRDNDISMSLILQELKSVEISEAGIIEDNFFKPSLNILFLTVDDYKETITINEGVMI